MIPRAVRRLHYRGEEFPGSEYTPEECEVLRAIDRYKREQRRPFPTWIEILDLLRTLGWRKVG